MFTQFQCRKLKSYCCQHATICRINNHLILLFCRWLQRDKMQPKSMLFHREHSMCCSKFYMKCVSSDFRTKKVNKKSSLKKYFHFIRIHFRFILIKFARRKYDTINNERSFEGNQQQTYVSEFVFGERYLDKKIPRDP